MKIFRFILVLIAFFTASFSVRAQIEVRVKFTEAANLAYQLDCVSGLPIFCSRRNLGELWKREFLKNDEDRALIEQWKNLRDLYAQDMRIPGRTGGRNSYISVFEKIRIAGFQSENIEDFAARFDLLTAPADRASFERILRHFEPRFKIWWEKEAVKNGGDFAKNTSTLLRSPQISSLIKQFYVFYAPDLPAGYEIIFNLFYIPDIVQESIGGQQLQNYSLMEFKPRDKPEQRIDIAVHELTHFFYESMKAENAARLRESFYDARRPGAIPALNILNETLATAFGNGMIARTVAPQDKFEQYRAGKLSFYNDEEIDRAAKATLDWLDEWLKNKRSINHPDFVEEYIAALESEFGKDLTAPRMYLGEMFLFVDEQIGGNGALRRFVRNKIRINSFSAAEANLQEKTLAAIKSDPHLNSLFIVRPENIAQFAADQIITGTEASEIQKALAEKDGVLFGKQRSPFTYIYIAVANDAAAAQNLIEHLAAAEQFEGIYKK